MATPSLPLKRLLAAGAKKSAQVWGTAEALGAGYGMLLEGDGGLSRKQPYVPAKEADTPFVLEGDLGNIDPVDFSPAFTMRYAPGALGILIAQLFGTAGNPTLLGGATYVHTLQWADENYGEFATFAVERASKILEVASAKPYALDLNVGDGLIKGTIALRGNTLINTSAANTATQMDALTYADRGNRLKFSQLSLYMNDQVNGSVTSETALEVSDLSLHFERPHDSEHKAGSQFIVEPAESGHPVITVMLKFPRMNAVNAAYFADFIAETEKKMALVFIGAALATDTYALKIYYPRMRITSIDYPFDDVVPGSITLQAEEAAANPTGMDYARPYVLIQNTRSTNYLA